MKIEVVKELPKRGKWLWVAEASGDRLMWYAPYSVSGVCTLQQFQNLIDRTNPDRLVVKTAELKSILESASVAEDKSNE